MAYSISSSTDGCYEGTTVLVNKLGLRDQDALDAAERVAVPLRAVEAEEKPKEGAFTFDYYLDLHKLLFGDLYDWAGQLRQVNLSKKGTNFCQVEELQTIGEAKFAYLQRMKEFRRLDRKSFVDELTDFYHEINMLHPFREGNGRTQRLFFTLLIRRAGYDIHFDEQDTDELMIATIYAAQGILDPLRKFFEQAIVG